MITKQQTELVAFITKRQHWSLLGVIVIWSFSPLVVRGFRGAFNPTLAASYAVVLGTMMMAAYLRFLHADEFRQAISVLKQPSKSTSHLYGLGFLAFWVYPVFYFNGLHSETPIGANILNYTWPLVLVLTRIRLYPPHRSAWLVVGVLVSLLGSLIATGTATGFRQLLDPATISLTQPLPSTTLGGMKLKPYLCAFVGALAYGLYSAIISEVRPSDSAGQQLTHKARFFVMLCFSGVIHLITIISIYMFAAHSSTTRFTEPVCFYPILCIVIYALISLLVGHLLWMYIRTEEADGRCDMPSAPSTYFIFVLGTLLLSLDAGRDAISPDVLCGMALVLCGICISASDFGLSPSAAFTLGIALSLGLSMYFRVGNHPSSPVVGADADSHYLTILESLTGVFAILSGFILHRVYSRAADINRLFLDILASLNRFLQLSGGSAPLKQFACDQAEQVSQMYLAHVWPYGVSKGLPGHAKDIQHGTTTAKPEDLLSTEITNQLFRNEAECILREIRSNGRQWMSFNLQSVSRYERLVLWTIVCAMLLLLFQVHIVERPFLLVRAVFTAALIVILAAIEEHQRGRLDYAKEAISSSAELKAASRVDHLLECASAYQGRRTFMTWCFVSLVALLLLIYSAKLLFGP